MTAKSEELEMIANMEPGSRQDIHTRLKECVNAKLRIESEKAHIKKIVDKLKDDYDVSLATFNELIKALFDEQYVEELVDRTDKLETAQHKLQNSEGE